MASSFCNYLSGRSLAFGAVVAVTCLGATCLGARDAHANDFFSNLFGGFLGHAPASQPLSYAPDNGSQDVQRPRRSVSSGGRQAFCVRTCDGRYFPVQAGNGESRAASCNSFCPASETKVFYGSSIDHASSEVGKQYSELPNAFKYRSEIVPGCTCNGKNQFGLAKVDIRDDSTIRKGDLVAGADGLMVAGHSVDKRGASLKLSPASEAIRARFEHVPVVASD
ncbi:MAG: DUF2865 domain-containing protein [Proteobacteria bacterium]|nr:DUF2865 domain-containing protein [Pseudomonadota bacterium]